MEIQEYFSNSHLKESKFLELKGNCFTPTLKRDFVDFFCRNEYFELFYIVVNNTCWIINANCLRVRLIHNPYRDSGTYVRLTVDTLIISYKNQIVNIPI